MTVDPRPGEPGRLSLSWDTPNGNGDPIQSYVLEHDGGNGGAYTVVYNGPDTSTSIGGLLSGLVYKFRVKATNSEGTGQYSPVLQASSTSSPPSPCDAPTLVKSKPNSISVRWGEPDARGSEIRGYVVMVAPSEAKTLTNNSRPPPADAQYTRCGNPEP